MEFTEKLLGDGETTANRTTDEGASSREQTSGAGAAVDDTTETSDPATDDAARGGTFSFRDGDVATDERGEAAKNGSEQRNGDGPRHDVAADLGTETDGRAKRGKPDRTDGASAPQDDVVADVGKGEPAVAGADSTADAQRTGTAEASSGAAEPGTNDAADGESGVDSATRATTPTPGTPAPASDDSTSEPHGATDDRTGVDAGSTHGDVAAPMDGRSLHIGAAQSITITEERAVRIAGARDVALVAESKNAPQNEHASETAAPAGSPT